MQATLDVDVSDRIVLLNRQALLRPQRHVLDSELHRLCFRL